MVSFIRKNSQYTQAHQNTQYNLSPHIHLRPIYDEDWNPRANQIRKCIEACKKYLASFAIPVTTTLLKAMYVVM